MGKLFVLGAGFSRYAGLPLGSELFPAVVAEARKSDLFTNILEPDLNRYRTFVERTTGCALTESMVDVEQFVAFLDVEHYLRFRGSDVYADEGDRSQQLIKNLIAQLLLSCQRRITPKLWQPYISFASRLQPEDIVITFNYDTVLEQALERVGTPYRLFPQRFDEVYASHAIVKYPETEVVILKLHGSIDWFDIEPWRRNREYFANSSVQVQDRHPIFGDHRLCEPTTIVDEPYPDDSLLRRVHRVENLDGYLSSANLVIEAPLLLSPSHNKLLYADPLKELWRDMSSFGAAAETVAIVGFSMPPHDHHAVHAIYSIARNFQHYDTGNLISKSPLRFVDWCPTDGLRLSLMERYRFIDWSRTELDFGGFRPEAVPFLFEGVKVDH